jgi:hypothetical protein
MNKSIYKKQLAFKNSLPQYSNGGNFFGKAGAGAMGLISKVPGVSMLTPLMEESKIVKKNKASFDIGQGIGATGMAVAKGFAGDIGGAVSSGLDATNEFMQGGSEIAENRGNTERAERLDKAAMGFQAGSQVAGMTSMFTGGAAGGGTGGFNFNSVLGFDPTKLGGNTPVVMKNGGKLKQYPDGGIKQDTLFTSNPNDPRLQAYRDSLFLHNNAINDINSLRAELAEDNQRLIELPTDPSISRSVILSLYRDDVNRPENIVNYTTEGTDYVWNMPLYRKPNRPVAYKSKPQEKPIDTSKLKYKVSEPEMKKLPEQSVGKMKSNWQKEPNYPGVEMSLDEKGVYRDKQGVFTGEIDSKVPGKLNVLERFDNGGMIKRADGSYSKRGLWDNIRDNAGSGKEPTPEMLEQERKIKAKYEDGGGLSRSEDYGSKKKPYPNVSSGDFAGGNRSYPIPTKADAVDALRLAGLHGRNDVKSKVYAKYPSLKKEDGGLIQYNLPTHESGGGAIDANGKVVNPNSPLAVAELEKTETLDTKQNYVFSDTLKPMKSKLTFADLSKKIDNKYKDKNDAIATKSKDRELERLAQSNEELRLAKEAKTNPNPLMMAKNGGKLKNKLEAPVLDPDNIGYISDEYGNVPNPGNINLDILKSLDRKDMLEKIKYNKWKNTEGTMFPTKQDYIENMAKNNKGQLMKNGGKLPKYFNGGDYNPYGLGSGTVDTLNTMLPSESYMTKSNLGIPFVDNKTQNTIPEVKPSLTPFGPQSLNTYLNPAKKGVIPTVTDEVITGEQDISPVTAFGSKKALKKQTGYSYKDGVLGTYPNNNQQFTMGDKAQLAGLAPATIYNTIQALRPAEKFSPLNSPLFGAGLNDMNQNVRFNTNPILMNRNVGANQINQGSTSDAVRRANLQSLYRGTNTQLGEMAEKEALTNAQIKQSLGQAKIGVGAQDVAAQERARQYNVQARQAKQQFGATAASQFGQGLTEFGKSSNQGLSNRIGYDVLKNISPNFTLTEYNRLVKAGMSDGEIIKFINK